MHVDVEEMGKESIAARILRMSLSSIVEAAKALRKGEVVIYPTDTVYGLGCNPFNVKAVRRIFEIKGRERKPLPILASSIGHIERIAYVNEKARILAEKFWPGPLTLVLKKKPSLPSEVTCGSDSVGVRVPRHDLLLHLIELSGGLIVGTSANISGKKPSRTALEAMREIGDKVDIILDGGETPIGISSTVLDLTSDLPRILRKGPIKAGEILDVLRGLEGT